MICKICGKEFSKQRWHEPICSDECFTDNYWLERVNNKASKSQVVINGYMFQIGSGLMGGSKGFDGAKFVILFNDGRKVITDNLWSNGEIPEKFRAQLPDNAKWGNVAEAFE